MATIICDMDGITTATLPKWLLKFNEICHRENMRDQQLFVGDITEFAIEGFAKTEAARQWLWLVTRDYRFWRDLPLMPGAAEGITRLQKAGHRVVIGSSPMHSECARAKYDWLAEHLPMIGKRDIVLLNQKTLLRAEAIIDDHPETIENAKHLGMVTATLHWPYSKNNADIIGQNWEYSEDGWEQITEGLIRKLW